jgi:predicted DNA repair protein MutK
MQILTVSVVSILATVGVYGLVGLIVRMDDVGYSLIKKSNQKGILNSVGIILVKTLPLIIKFFAVVGTVALIMVSGGIFAHNIDYLHHILPQWPDLLKELCYGILGGLMALLLVHITKLVIRLIK